MDTASRAQIREIRYEFGWLGTSRPYCLALIPHAIEFLGSLFDGGWKDIMEHNGALAIQGRRILCGALGTSPPVPDSMVSSVAAVEMQVKGMWGR